MARSSIKWLAKAKITLTLSNLLVLNKFWTELQQKPNKMDVLKVCYTNAIHNQYNNN